MRQKSTQHATLIPSPELARQVHLLPPWAPEGLWVLTEMSSPVYSLGTWADDLPSLHKWRAGSMWIY